MKRLIKGGVLQSVIPPPEWGYWREMIPNRFVHKVSKALILGVGLGTIPALLKEAYPNVKIIGVDNKSYKCEVEMEFVKADAFDYVATCHLKFDLIVVDLWDGGWYPTYVLTVDFLNSLKKLLAPRGKIYINAPDIEELARKNNLSVKKFVPNGLNIIYETG